MSCKVRVVSVRLLSSFLFVCGIGGRLRPVANTQCALYTAILLLHCVMWIISTPFCFKNPFGVPSINLIVILIDTFWFL